MRTLWMSRNLHLSPMQGVELRAELASYKGEKIEMVFFFP